MRSRPARRPAGDAGGATAELAVALPAVVLVLAVVLGAGRVAVAQLQCTDAARAGARVAARGEAAGVVRAAAGALAPAGARITVSGGGAGVLVRVEADVEVAGTGARLTVRGQGTAAVETHPVPNPALGTAPRPGPAPGAGP
ncbi:hypothetical protein NUM3379_23220 [Kineococcus sp. NUM-3379]